ncbi:macrophage mannose receptor 1-like isoform X2 [Poeciliopsis prolifica]|uniref:macrophage mannose receptor 1-like isoform X2 n=1 Tax=Poeciliopsis prolifica TaxID=188132 RepID=UPI002414563B|nr:macrophage mannose receptor 1-like isoform X2 [Poeciliopsis prolifica]
MMDALHFLTAASLLCAASARPPRVFVFVNELMSWPDAQSFCRQNFLDLASVSSMEDVTLLTQMVDLDAMLYMDASFKHRAWIGLSEDLDSWTWSITDPDFYRDGEAAFRNWNIGEPNNYQGKESCVGMWDNGLWNDNPCQMLAKAICHDVREHNVSLTFVNQAMSWPAAQSYCRERHTDLASVRSSPENEQIKGLVQSAGEVQAWIGLYRNSWLWVDGSNSSFRHWKASEPNGSEENCAAAVPADGGCWEDWPCSWKMPFYCHAGSQQVVKVKLVTSSSLDLSDPAVLADLLQQFEQKLKASRENVKLSWRETSGGQIFHQEQR